MRDPAAIAIATVPGTLTIAGVPDIVAAALGEKIAAHFDYAPPAPDAGPFAGRFDVALNLATDSPAIFTSPIADADWREIPRRPAQPNRDVVGATAEPVRRGLGFYRVQQYLLGPENGDEIPDALYATRGGSWVRVPADGGDLSGFFAPADADELAAIADMVACAVARIWRLHGCFVLHCAAVVSPTGIGALFPAYSGNGKSGLLLALVRAGQCNLVGDDKLILHRDRETGLVRGFPMQRFVNLATDVADHYADLEFLRGCTDSPTWPKVRIDMRRVNLGDEPVSEMRPAMIGFPRIAGGGSTRRRPARPMVAVEQLLTQSVVPVENVLARRQIETLAALAAQCRCEFLDLGWDVYREPAALARRLEIGA